ncbi:hypothetical protein GCK72_021540 [Caenorhabditis remanei]|uniref:Uncharacterized protein n=1 Tax=Caenorhabditis remanei TaxID=31234 RepID=A0A6A5GJS9_CAERE|nr:hypothetical protein GCK72_021540 [Caenorhabditis remanei]KAF1754974.1 hypothetical protein GCK72_021540 [Caenorhabditis remanei]
MWKCTRNVEDGRLSLEPVACQSVERNENYEVLSPGSSRTMNNGSVKHSCDIGDGRLKSVFEFVPGCYHNGIVYQLGDEWQEENQGDKHLVQNVTMECVRSESGYFDKKVTECKFNSEEEYDVHHLGNNSLYIEKFIDYITIRLNNYYEKSDLVIVEDSDGIQSSKRVNTRHLKCVETEPGHVTLINVTEEETGCTYKNQTYLHKSSWVDVTQGAGLRCGNGNEVMKDYCSLNGKMHTLGEELKLSNGCVFVCDEQRNIYICDDLLKL